MSLENRIIDTKLISVPDDEQITEVMQKAIRNPLADIVCLTKEDDRLNQTRHVPYALREKQDYDRLAQVRKDMRSADLVVVRKAKIT